MVSFLCLMMLITVILEIMRRTKLIPEVNAGSMADIAFLLLIFFLITAAIPKDKGINRKLPNKCPKGVDCSAPIPDRNILAISINANSEIMIDKDLVKLTDVKLLVKRFIDNNGDKSCNYCKGEKLQTLSDNPQKAVVSLQTDRNTSYSQFIEVQDELTKAYYEVRKDYSKAIFNKEPEDLTKEEMQKVKKAYPFILSEAETR